MERKDVKMGIIESMTISRPRLTALGEQQKAFAERTIKRTLKKGSHRYQREWTRLFNANYSFCDLYSDEVSHSSEFQTQTITRAST